MWKAIQLISVKQKIIIKRLTISTSMSLDLLGDQKRLDHWILWGNDNKYDAMDSGIDEQRKYTPGMYKTDEQTDL